MPQFFFHMPVAAQQGIAAMLGVLGQRTSDTRSTDIKKSLLLFAKDVFIPSMFYVGEKIK